MNRQPVSYVAKSIFVVMWIIAAAVFASTLTANDIFSKPTAKDIPELIRSLRDPGLRLGASRALGTLKHESVGPLTESLSDESTDVRIWSAFTLGKIGVPATPAVPALLKRLTDSRNTYERAAIVEALGRINPGEPAARQATIAALIRGLADNDSCVRRMSAASLGMLNPPAVKSVPNLVAAFADESSRYEAVSAVVRIGKPAVPHLATALEDNALRFEAVQALRKIGSEVATETGVASPSPKDLPALKGALLDDERQPDARIRATRELGQIGVESGPVLIAAFPSDVEEVSRAAAAAFRDVGEKAVPLLIEAASNEEAVIRTKSIDALGAIGPAARAAVPLLIESLQDEDRTVRHRAVIALDALRPSGSEAVPALIQVMQNPRDIEGTRQLALKVLVRTHSEKQRESVIAALKESSKDDNFGVRSLAAGLLKKLEAEVPPSGR